MRKILLVFSLLLILLSGCAGVGMGYVRYTYPPAPPPSTWPYPYSYYPYYEEPFYWGFGWYWWPPVYVYPSAPPFRMFHR